jgi:hypothetical protein
MVRDDPYGFSEANFFLASLSQEAHIKDYYLLKKACEKQLSAVIGMAGLGVG